MKQCKDWINDLASKGLTPKMIEIERPEKGTEKKREEFWIKYYQKKVGNLFNKRHLEVRNSKKLNIVYL